MAKCDGTQIGRDAAGGFVANPCPNPGKRTRKSRELKNVPGIGMAFVPSVLHFCVGCAAEYDAERAMSRAEARC